MLQRFFAKYTGILRNLKISYVVNNWLNAGRLRRNRELYRRYGLRKSIYAPIGNADFGEKHHADIPWLDRDDSAIPALEADPVFQGMDAVLQEKLRGFVRDGYMVLENFFPKEKTDALNAEVDALLQSGQAGYNYTGRKIFNLWEKSPLADESFFRNPEMLRLLSFMLGKPVIPFQSLNFTVGSEQRAHSDSIHMTTEPPGYLIATWIALEDCPTDCGPLFYYDSGKRAKKRGFYRQARRRAHLARQPAAWRQPDPSTRRDAAQHGLPLFCRRRYLLPRNVATTGACAW